MDGGLHSPPRHSKACCLRSWPARSRQKSTPWVQTSRTALEIASLAGPTFTSGAVASAWNVNVTVVEEVFAALARRGQIIRARQKPSHGYTFRHPVYADLLARDAPFAQQMRAAQRLEDLANPKLRRALTLEL